MDFEGFRVPGLRAVVTTAYLFLVPGALALGLMRPRGVGFFEALVFSLGLSTSIMMFSGLALNSVGSVLGFARPISSVPVIAVLGGVTLGLGVLAQKTHRYPLSFGAWRQLRKILSPLPLAVLLTPVLAVLGVEIFNESQSNLLLLITIAIMALLSFIIGVVRVKNSFLYPLTILAFAIALVLHRSLVSGYLWGWDIQFEYRSAFNVLNRSSWNPSIPSNVNAMLSIVMLAPVLSLTTGLDLVWVFKILYPLVFSLVPLSVYLVVQKQTGSTVAFASALFFLFLFLYYEELLQLARQQIAELFLVLIALLLVGKARRTWPHRTLLVLFLSSLTVSHYGTAYLFMFMAMVVGALTVPRRGKAMGSPRELTLATAAMIVVFNLSWYLYVAGSSPLTTVLQIGNQIAQTMTTDFLNPNTAQGLGLILKGQSSPLHVISKYVQLLTQFLIPIGFVAVLVGLSKEKFTRTYMGLSAANLILLIAGVAIPFFASSLNASRLYQLALVFMAPFFAIGWQVLGRGLVRSLVSHSRLVPTTVSRCALFAFLAAFLLFNSGFIYQIANDNPTSISLSPSIDYPLFDSKDVASADWLGAHAVTVVNADAHRYQLLVGKGVSFEVLSSLQQTFPPNTLLFLGGYNTAHGAVLVVVGNTSALKYVPLEPLVAGADLVYDSGGPQIWY